MTMASLYLNKLMSNERHSLILKLHDMQSGCCFICEQPIDIKLQGDSLDIDHVEPLKVGGKDSAENFAMTHASCNRSKQASDLRVARVLARFERIRRSCAEESRGPNLADVLGEYGGAKHELAFDALECRVARGDLTPGLPQNGT
jgi:hypothetical protein